MNYLYPLLCIIVYYFMLIGFLFVISIIDLRDGQIHRERKRPLPYTGSLPKCLPCSGLQESCAGQSRAGHQELEPASLRGCQGSSYLSHHLLLLYSACSNDVIHFCLEPLFFFSKNPIFIIFKVQFVYIIIFHICSIQLVSGQRLVTRVTAFTACVVMASGLAFCCVM